MTVTNLSQVVPTVLGILDDFALAPDFLTKISLVFGEEKAANITTNGLLSALNTLPAIDVRASEELNGGLGAFSSQTGKIYLSEGILNDQDLVIRVLLEEIGHYLDNYFGGDDADGDEGAIFASLVLGETLDATQLTQLQQENDHSKIIVDDVVIDVEMADITGDEGNNEITGTNGNDLLKGLGGNDTLYGLDNSVGGKDTLDGGEGVNTLYGGNGDDILINNFGVADGDNGTDILVADYTKETSFTSGIFNSSNNDDIRNGSGGAVILDNRELEQFDITGTQYNDILYGFANSDTLVGGAGDDSLIKQLYTLGDSIYLLSNSGTWDVAQAEAQSFGGNLVTINDAKEQTFLAGLFANQNAWIGLNDAATEGTFKWISGESVSYTNWQPGQPDNAYSADFALLGSNSEWYDTYQTDNRQGIIEIKNPTTPILIIEDLGILEPYSGTKQAFFKVKLFGSSSQQIKVNYATANNTALAGSNYTTTSGTLTFNPGEKEKLISVTILNDGEVLSGKQFSVNLTSPVNAIIGDKQSTATIHESSDAVTFGGSTYLLSEPGTWGAAQLEATTFGGNLVTINNAAESAFLAGVYANQGAWIALNDAGGEAGNDPTKFQWFNGTTAYTNWTGGQPDNAYSGDFALLGGNSEWYDTYQTDIRPGIIEIPTPLSVPIPDMTGRQLYTFGDSIYLLSNSGTWGQAQVEAQSFQGNLVTINDAKEQTFLAGLFANQNAWIGLNDAATEGTFKWISGESVSYTNWQPGQPDNAYSADFALLGSNSEWYDTYQTDNRQGIIEIKNPTTPILIIEDLGILEPYSGTKQAFFKVKLFGSSSQQIKVNYATANNTALAGSNYTTTSGTLTFNPGEKEKLISVTILNDGEVLSGKQFSVNLTSPVNAIIGDKQSTATIHESSDAVTFGGSTYLLSEPGTWGAAQLEATTFGGNLVTINNAAESAFLAGVYANQGAWIALNDAGGEAGNDPTKFQWFNGTTAYTNWTGGQPDNAYSGDFALLGGNSEWYDTYQTDIRPGIIEIPTPLSVPIPDMTGRQLYTFNGNGGDGGGGGSDIDDQFEENDSRETAAQLTELTNGLNSFDNLVILSNDDDYYRFSLLETGQLGNKISIEFEHIEGDLDLKLYRVSEDGTFVSVGESYGVSNLESISLAGQQVGDYVALVYGFAGTSNEYSLSLDLPAGNVPLEDDIYEDNNNSETATILEESQLIKNLNITEGDEDWFRLDLVEDGDKSDRIRVDFTHALGDLDIQLWSKRENFAIRTSLGLGNSESISLDGLAEGTYFLRVFGFEGATNPNYSLEIQAPLDNSGGGLLTADNYEPNDDANSASELGVLNGFNEYAGLSIHQENNEDWFSFTTAGAGNVDVMLNFAHDLGDIDLEIFSGNDNTSLARSTTISDDEFVRVTNAVAGETFLVKVSGYEGATNSYEMVITTPVGAFVAPDKYDENGDNNSLENAQLLGDFRTRDTGVVSEDETGKSVVIEDLTIDNVTDEDWFEFRIQQTGKADSQISVLSDQGDLTLALFDAEGNLLSESATEGSGYETISLLEREAGTYYAQVTGANGSTNGNYAISLNSPQPTIVGEARDSWTIIVYMAADNDLEMNAIRDLNELESINLPDNVNIVVQLDRSEGYDSSNGDWTDTRRGLVQYDPNSSTNNGQIVSLGEATAIGEANMGDGATLTEFIDWSKENYAAQNYALVVWNHGGGLSGVAWDDQSVIDGVVDNLGIAEISQAVDNSQVDKFGVIGFDASSQGLIEHGYDLRNLTEVFVASQDLEPGDGWNYEGLLQSIVAEPTLDSEDLGAAIVNSYEEYYNGLETLSAIRSSSYQAIGEQIDIFVDAVLTNATEDDWNEIIQARYETPSFYNENYRDLGLFMDNVAANVATGAIATAATEVANAVEGSLIKQVDGLETSGINIYLSPANSNLLNEYENNSYEFSFLEDSNWENFLLGLGERTGETRVKEDASEKQNGIDGVVQRDNNDSFPNATDLGLLSGPESFGDLSIDRGDVDYYRFDFETPATTETNVSIESEGVLDLKLKVFNADQGLLAEVDLVDGTESINLGELTIPDGVNNLRYYVQVEGDSGKTVVDDYTLVINAPDADANVVKVDRAETKDGVRNDSWEKATDIGQLGAEQKVSFENLTIDPLDLRDPNSPMVDPAEAPPDAGDWFLIKESRGSDFGANNAKIKFNPEEANLNAYLYRKDAETGELRLVDSSTSIDSDEESVSFNSEGDDSLTGDYYLGIFSDPLTAGGTQGATISEYQLTFSQVKLDFDGNGRFEVQDTQLFFASRTFTSEQFDPLNNTYGFIQDGAQRTFGDDLFSYLENADAMADLDGDGQISIQDTQLLFIYSTFGQGNLETAAAAIDQLNDTYGLIQDGATRTTGAQISAHIGNFLGEF
ncbi:lectin-like protein [Crocosphaera sp. XPORK-15E]|uniref:lectin-like protein n=1 Tax=Crocosphaera sp. XPORK-15E TaxID=3110247 RepID=UPI002B1F621B|nr:lectin-like protein [Crocosphaera sp. XPORK-15E]MEA5534599.1 lectin-like protein [Crocosphaera sp. XPORK-15E]